MTPGPPRQTQHADFPHCAFLLPSQHRCRKAAGNGIVPGSVLLRFCSDKRNASCKRTQHDNSRVPLLDGHYPASSLLWTPPTPDEPAYEVMDPPNACGLRPPAHRASQVPRPLFRDAPSALTPMGRPGAHAGCFPLRAGFSISDSLATHHLCFETVTGSALTAHRFAVRCSHTFAWTPSSRPASLPVPRYLRTTGRSYMSNQQFTWQPPLRLLEWPGLSWRTKGTKGKA